MPVVHPRAGGERPLLLVLGEHRVGSSPRGRGTLDRTARLAAVHRFIPARAGNASGASLRRSGPPVHPRAGGERRSPRSRLRDGGGSSPRGRGTRHSRGRWSRRRRFIPARAGNAYSGRPGFRQGSVHPRAGGERHNGAANPFSEIGSSPRGRGTRSTRCTLLDAGRFIPARAGNALSARARLSLGAVHPRAGGERRSGSQYGQK